MYDVITIGSATLDVFLSCENLTVIESNGEKNISFPYGAKIEVDDVLFETGGGGTNTATTFARLGFKTAVIAKIGEDFAGEKVIERVKMEGIDTSFLTIAKDETTDFSTIIWAPHKGSVILVNRGKGKLEINDVSWESLQTKWFYITSVEGNLEIINRCKNALIAWNPGKRELKQPEAVLDILGNIEVLILNRREATQLLNAPADDLNQLLSKAATLPPSYILITDGHNGSYLRHHNHQWLHAGVFTIDRKEATGAGDAFGSGFVAAHFQGLNNEDCLKLASANAASVVTSPSAKQGILRKEQVGEWLGRELTITSIT